MLSKSNVKWMGKCSIKTTMEIYNMVRKWVPDKHQVTFEPHNQFKVPKTQIK